MAMRHRLVLCGLLAGLTGCTPSASETAPSRANAADEVNAPADKTPVARQGGTGTINLGRVLTALGLTQQIEQRRRTLTERVASVQREKQGEFEKRRSALGDKPTPAQEQELRKLVVESQTAINSVREQAEKQMQEFNTYATNQLRQKIEKPVEEIAKRRGLTTVLLWPNPVIVYREPASDITDEVLEALRAGGAEGPVDLPASGPEPAKQDDAPMEPSGVTPPIAPDGNRSEQPQPSLPQSANDEAAPKDAASQQEPTP